ncbi:WD40 repeat domain-containing protein [Ilumatobacter coccineus]|uniref:Uncharacterized protein n=1 Tax=Ilumatobacter coccineus (strain NBRC 103263 / KCTC 29153 / YM16-304) TaxID=1313172 RepID=A0A6C7E984_ILUCY|nr:WD40 repeat domain-containing protein [Ilumatobacter coccineus]BAN01779.1 hypothetical protein YM304_14650 [Ilumatobacter coccineus YM16-304]
MRSRDAANGVARRLALSGAAVSMLVAVAACASPVPTDGADSVPPPELVAPNDDERQLDPVAGDLVVSLARQLGRGRALHAAVHGDLIVVATTLGLVAGSPSDGYAEISATTNGETRNVQIAPDEQTALQLSADRLEVWRLGPGQDGLPPGPTAMFDDVVAAAYGSDSNVIVAGRRSLQFVASDGTVIDQFDIEQDRVVLAAAIADDSVVAALSSPDGPLALDWQRGQDPLVTPIDLPAQTEISAIRPVGESVVAMSWTSADDSFIGSIGMWDLRDREFRWTVDSGTPDSPWDVAADGSAFVAANGELRIVDPDGSESSVRLSSSQRVRWLLASASGESSRVRVVYAEGSSEVLGQTGESIAQLDGLGLPITAISHASDGSVLTVDLYGSIERRTPDGEIVDRFDDFVAATVNDVAISRTGSIASASANGTVRVDDSAARTTRLEHPEGNVDTVGFSDDGDRLVSGVGQRRSALAYDDTVVIWNVDRDERVASTVAEAEDVNGCSFFRNVVRFAPGGSFIVATSHDFTVTVLDAQTADTVHVLPPQASGILDLDIAADGSILVTVADDGVLRVWDLESYELVASHRVPDGGARNVAVLPGADVAIVGDLLGRVQRIDLRTGEMSAPFEGEKLRTAEIAVSPDGKLIAAGTADSLVNIWSVADGRLVASANGHQGAVQTAAFGDDGQTLVTGSQDGTTIVWRLEAR